MIWLRTWTVLCYRRYLINNRHEPNAGNVLFPAPFGTRWLVGSGARLEAVTFNPEFVLNGENPRLSNFHIFSIMLKTALTTLSLNSVKQIYWQLYNARGLLPRTAACQTNKRVNKCPPWPDMSTSAGVGLRRLRLRSLPAARINKEIHHFCPQQIVSRKTSTARCNL